LLIQRSRMSMDPIPSLSSPERMSIRMQFLLRIPFALIKLDQVTKHGNI
jgi:hypothetical protein